MSIPTTHQKGARLLLTSAVAVALLLSFAYVIYPMHCRASATDSEANDALPGDSIVVSPKAGYTLAITIKAAPHEIWPWLLQMGQGRGGFYTHEWIENLIGADIHNADSIIPALQHLAVGDSVRLTPDPYLGGQRGQYIVVSQLDSPRVMIFRHELPNGATGSWSYILSDAENGNTRLVFRRRSSEPSLFDRIALPGYYFMDIGMLSGIKERAERNR